MPLSGHLFEYTDRVELVNRVASFFAVQSLQQIRLIEVNVEEIIEDLHVDVYAIIDPLQVKITRSALADGGTGSGMAWDKVINEDLLRLAVQYHSFDLEFENLFANPHPIVVDMILISPHIVAKVSANPSPHVIEWLFTHHPDSIDWAEMCGSSNPDHVARAVEHFRQILTVTPNSHIPPKAVLNLLSTASSEFAIEYLGGFDQVMGKLFPPLEFIRSSYAVARKREWVAAHMGQNGYDFLLRACMQTEDVELVRMGFDGLIASPSNPWKTVDEVLRWNSEMWCNECDVMVDHLVAYMDKNATSSVLDECRARLATNEHPRVVDFLLANVNANGNEDEEKVVNDSTWLKMPEFLSNTNERAVAYSIAWIERHYASLLANPHQLQTCASAASGNTHTEMIYAIHNRFPLLKTSVESRWLFTLGCNPDIRVALNDSL